MLRLRRVRRLLSNSICIYIQRFPGFSSTSRPPSEIKRFQRGDEVEIEEFNIRRRKTHAKLINSRMIKKDKALPLLPHPTFSLPDFGKLDKLQVCSRNMANILIREGFITVDHKPVREDVSVGMENYLRFKFGIDKLPPMRESVRLWAFHKPRGFVSNTYKDPYGRPTVVDAFNKLNIRQPKLITIGRLDYLSDGLLLVTNDDELGYALESPLNQIIKTYRVRIYGKKFTSEKLERLRRIKEESGKPLIVEVEKGRGASTWLHIKSSNKMSADLRGIFRKLNLRVDRIKRLSYGDYKGGLVPNPLDVLELEIGFQFRFLMGLFYRDRLREAQQTARKVYYEGVRREGARIESYRVEGVEVGGERNLIEDHKPILEEDFPTRFPSAQYPQYSEDESTYPKYDDDDPIANYI